TGSGVVVDAASGYVLTNGHVVENATRIDVTTKDNRRFTAKLIGRDADTDVALLQIPAEGLTAVPMGDSDRLQVGDFVLAIGNPFGLGQTVTSGIVSALGRSGLGVEGFEDFIQTDASINPGNSGGALVNLRGELIGINTEILSRNGGNLGIGFAIPINMARGVMDQLVKYGSVRRGQLGVSMYTVTPDIAHSLGLASAAGALVSQVVEGSPADQAGVRVGDVITSANGQPVKSNSELRNVIGLLRVGDRMDIGLVRDGKPMRVTAFIAAAPGH
ncbi:MAG TPA: trypsin-like peptidase domain-containing protein, partial [Steroidobacteraceae bacterium]|nr:trypsin-like peptidase domain-containing protein [Steroidobacteraceae bacterium]